jgi:hypothetical protein
VDVQSQSLKQSKGVIMILLLCACIILTGLLLGHAIAKGLQV